MADKVQGNNMILYWQNPNGVFYLNGGVSQGTISGNTYYELSSTENVGASADFTATGNNVIARFITDVNKPNMTSILAGTWTFSSYVSITTDLTSSPSFYFVVSKYDGTTFTTIATSSTTVLTSISKTLYSTSLTFPSTALGVTDRIAITVYPLNVAARNITFYTQGTNVSKVTTTIPTDIPFACSTNCSFSVNVDQKEVTSQTSAWYREFKNDIANWSVNCDGLITLDNYGYLYLLQTQQNRTQIAIKFAIDNGVDGLVIIGGNCNLTSLQINAPYKDIGTYSVGLQGSGAYTTSGTSINQNGVIVTSSGQVYMKSATAAGGETTITFADMIGKTCLGFTRGGVEVREILTTGTPTNDQIKFTSASGVVTFGRALEADEFIRGIFQ
jgi:predicted secreted protein